MVWNHTHTQHSLRLLPPHSSRFKQPQQVHPDLADMGGWGGTGLLSTPQSERCWPSTCVVESAYRSLFLRALPRQRGTVKHLHVLGLAYSEPERAFPHLCTYPVCTYPVFSTVSRSHIVLTDRDFVYSTLCLHVCKKCIYNTSLDRRMRSSAEWPAGGPSGFFAHWVAQRGELGHWGSAH